MKFEIAPAGVGLSCLREDFAKPSLALMAVVAILLLIACANVAGLLLARGQRASLHCVQKSNGGHRPAVFVIRSWDEWKWAL
jgi:hypothetical protein